MLEVMEEKNPKKEATFPMRINRYLALQNYCSRREADDLILKGIVFVNGKIAKIGQKVQENDKVTVNAKKQIEAKKYVYFAYNKNKGIVTHSPKDGQKSISQMIYMAQDVFPVGRLDKNSRGLIILTNDGRVTDKLLSPEYEHEKEYVVSLNKPITNIFLKIMRQGVQLEDFKTRPATVEKKNEKTFNIILTEGKKHQIRRMCANLGWDVVDLRRTRIMNVRLGSLGAGQCRKIEGKELATFLQNLGI